MKKSKKFYYQLFEPNEPITPPPTKLDEAKEKLTATHFAVCMLALIFCMSKLLEIIALHNNH